MVVNEDSKFFDNEHGRLVKADCAIGDFEIGRQICHSYLFNGVRVEIFTRNLVSVMAPDDAAYEDYVSVAGFSDEID